MTRFVFFSILCTILGYGIYLGFNPFTSTYLSRSGAIEITEKESVTDIAESLWEAGAFKHRIAYNLFLITASVFPPQSQITYDDTRDRRNFALALLNDFVETPIAYVKIDEGMRVAQVANELQDVVGWSDYQKEIFVGPTNACNVNQFEGYIYPSTYAVAKNSNPAEVRRSIVDNFETKLKDLVDEASKKGLKSESVNVIDEKTAVIIASLIQRETGGVSDMRLISGIIWNRLFADMSLDLDATLQYAKANNTSDNNTIWWPRVTSQDKYIDSPYNTYQNKGLPPTPIAIPSSDALLAAVNPVETDCLFYLHDSKKRIHCSKTYSQHKQNIDIYLR